MSMMRERVRQWWKKTADARFGGQPETMSDRWQMILATAERVGTVGKSVVRSHIDLRGCRRGRWVTVEGRAILQCKGKLEIGDRCKMIGFPAPIHISVGRKGALSIGADAILSTGVRISASQSVRIERSCWIGDDVIIMDTDHHRADDRDAEPKIAEVVIDEGAWLASRVIVLKGVRVGRGAVVAAGAVVTKDVPEYTLAAGVPAQVVRQLDTKARSPVSEDALEGKPFSVPADPYDVEPADRLPDVA